MITLVQLEYGVSILTTDIDYSNTDGYVVVDELPSEPQFTWKIENRQLIIDEEKLKEWEEAQKPVIPTELTAYQARAVLDDFGLLEQIEKAMPTLDKKVQIAWEYAISFKRNHPFIQSLISTFGITEEQLDQMFIKGSQYE